MKIIIHNMHTDYSVIVPAHNEASTLKVAIKRLCEFLRSTSEEVEVIIVENGSSDDTWRIAKELESNFTNVVATQSECGKGAAILKGWSMASSDVLMFLDADLSPAPDVLLRMYQAVKNKGGCAIADRFLRDSKIDRGLTRKFVSRVWMLAAGLFLHVPYMDYQCGAKAIQKLNLEKIKKETTERGWCFDLDLILWHLDRGLSVTRIPVEWNEKVFDGRTSKLSISRSVPKFLKSLINLRKRRNVRRML